MAGFNDAFKKAGIKVTETAEEKPQKKSNNYNGSKGGYNGNKRGGYNGNNRGGYNGNRNQSYGRNNSYAEPSAYVGAPYNFVPFNSSVISYGNDNDHNTIQNIPEHGVVKPKYLSGEITYQIVAKTPIMVDQGNGNFFVDENNRVSIPGSTMRGLIRSNVQTLSLSGFSEDIDDYNLMYREFAGKASALKERYTDVLGSKPINIYNGEETQQMSVLRNVRAGYIKNENGKYFIYDTVLDRIPINRKESDSDVMNYYVLSERMVINNYLATHNGKKIIPGKKFAYPLFEKNGKSILAHKLYLPLKKYVTGKPPKFASDYVKYNNEWKECYYKKIREANRKIIFEICSQQEGGEYGYIYTKKNNTTLYKAAGRGYYEIVLENGRISYGDKINKNGHMEGNDFVSDYKPYEIPCYYKTDGIKVTSVVARKDDPIDAAMDATMEAEGFAKGYAVSTGPMDYKKAIYIIPEMDMTEKRVVLRNNPYDFPMLVEEKDVKAFQIDLNKRENTLKTFGGKAHYDLPAPGDKRPVFYIYLNNRLYIGFTPHLRLFYDYSIKDGLNDEQKENKIDYTKAIFGFSGEQNYKSRVSFLDAVMQESYEKNIGLKRAVLAEPKPTSYHDYLNSYNGKGVTYNETDFSLRGMKQYWLRKELYDNVPLDKENKDYVSKFYPLPEKTVFEGKVRFNNLTESELGLLLWSMKLEKNSWMNVGKGKPLGYGAIKLSLTSVKKIDIEKAYSLDSLNLDPFSDVDVDVMIETYKKEINQKLVGTTIDETETVKTFFLMKDCTKIPDGKYTQYMELGGGFKNRTEPLPTVDEVLMKK